ncbi:MAG: PIG-L deacetylase family protein [Candidatus Omnitrophota bacterium]
MNPESLLKPGDRVMVFAPHPDDEIIGCAGIIQKAVKLGIPLRVVFFTYGDNNEWSFFLYRNHPVVMPKAARAMGLVRHDEAYAAAEEIGNPGENLVFLGYPDFRTLHIWRSHWGDSPPCRSMLTEAKKIPYANALRPGTPHRAEEIMRDLKTVLREFRPTKVFVSHAGDHNPDHVALYLFLQVALWDLENEMKVQSYPYLVHRKKWPVPRGYHPEELLKPPELFEQKIRWQTNVLSDEEIKQKKKATEKHKSQYDYSSEYLLSFVRKCELFGDFSIITLESGSSSEPLSLNRKEFIAKTPGELTDEEKALFVGLEEHSVRLEGGKMLIDLKLSRPFGKEVGASSFIFGYRQDRPFEEMPKLHVKFGALEHRTYDQRRKLPHDATRVIRRAKNITINVPLELLGDPQRVLMSTRTYLGDVPLDYVPWRVVKGVT